MFYIVMATWAKKNFCLMKVIEPLKNVNKNILNKNLVINNLKI